MKNLFQSYNWYYHQDLQGHFQWLTFVLLIWKIEGQNKEKVEYNLQSKQTRFFFVIRVFLKIGWFGRRYNELAKLELSHRRSITLIFLQHIEIYGLLIFSPYITITYNSFCWKKCTKLKERRIAALFIIDNDCLANNGESVCFGTSLLFSSLP